MGQVPRRRFLIASGAMLAAPLARAQQKNRVYRIALVEVISRQAIEHRIAGLEQGLREAGYLPGRDVVIEVRTAEGKVESLPEVVKEVVRSQPDVIVTAINTITSAVKAATQSIPIVMAIGTEVIDTGYAQSFAKPGGNITGITWEFERGATGIKRFEILKEIAPSISVVAVLWDPPFDVYKTVFDAAAATRGMRTFWYQYSGDPERDFAEMTLRGANAVLAISGSPMGSRRTELAALAIRHRLPISFPSSEYVEAGALMSYGPIIAGMYRSAARHVDKILKGVKPGDIPIEQPTAFDLIINMKTAKALGLQVPQVVLMRASRLIE